MLSMRGQVIAPSTIRLLNVKQCAIIVCPIRLVVVRATNTEFCFHREQQNKYFAQK